MASDDDNDMADMRARAREREQAALGTAARLSTDVERQSLEALREKQRRVQETAERASAYYAERPAPSQGEEAPAALNGRGPEGGKGKGGDEDEDDEEDEDDDDADEGPGLPGPPPAPTVEDEGEVFSGFRAAFPVTFGKQESKAAHLESIHSQTKRLDGGKPGDSKGAKGPKMTFMMPKRVGGAGGAGQAGHVAAEDRAGEGRVQEGRVLETPRPPQGVGGGAGRGSPEVGLHRPGRSEGGQNGVHWDSDGRGMVGPARPPGGMPEGRVGDGGGEMVGPPRPPPGQGEDEDEEGDEDEEEEDEEDEDEYRVPLSNEIVLKGHTKVVAALAVDPTGSRVLTGSYDYTIKMYDFQGMDAKLRSFRQLEPSEGHQVRAISWSPSAELFLAVTGSAQAKVYNRDGFTQGEYVRGDMYIRDAKHTKGHISGLTAGEWHPRERHTALTASEDGTLRIWDTTSFKSQKQVIKPKLSRPGRVSVTACTWGPDGRCVAAGLEDGSLQVWNVKAGWGSRPDLYVSKGHEAGEDVTGVLFSADGATLVTRSTDSTLKVWDVRKLKDPLAVFGDLTNGYAQTNVAWSPDERLLLTGTSADKGRGGQVVFFDKERLELVRRAGVSDHAVVRVAWHPRLNQIFATTGDKKQGGTHVLYDPKLSERGALASVAKAPRQPRPEDFFKVVAPPVIHNPHSLPMFREAPSRKRQREKSRQDPVQSQRPELPMSGPGFGGRVGQSKGSLLTQYLLREGGLKKEIWMDEDPREAILRHAEAAEKDPQIIAPAYATTQPQPVFHESDEEEEG